MSDMTDDELVAKVDIQSFGCLCGGRPVLLSSTEFGEVKKFHLECLSCERAGSDQRVSTGEWAKGRDAASIAVDRCITEWNREMVRPPEMILGDKLDQVIVDEMPVDPLAPPPDIIEEDTEAIQDGLDDIFHLEKVV